jgi:hypothetical protein
VTRIGRLIVGAWIFVLVVAVLLLLSVYPESGGGGPLSGVPLALLVPTLGVGYVILELRRLTGDAGAMRREMQTSRHELEAIRLELAHQRVEERAIR